MCKRLLILLVLMPSLIYSQYSIKGNISQGDNFSWILLYKVKDGKEIYVDNSDVNNGNFEFTISKNEKPAIYRVYYQTDGRFYVEFIYNKENINFTFKPNNPAKSTVFNSSEENIIYQNYYKNITSKQQELDSLQVAFFNSTDDKLDKKINKSYQKKLKELNTLQLDFENQSEGKLANVIIKSSKQYNAEKLIKKPENYLSEVKKHFFDAIDFNDSFLKNSTFITNKVLDYIFYLNQSDDVNTLNQMQEESVKVSLNKVESSSVFKKNMVESIINQFTENNNAEMVNFMLENYYNKLPNSLQDYAFKQHVLSEVKTAIGKKAPNIVWEENGVSKNLYDLSDANIYMVVFFSSGCSHCQVEIPEFHEFIKNVSNIKIIAIGLEDEKSSWENMVKNYTEFTNILDLDKWDSKRVEDYGINAIPNYFILDKDKIIIAKPEDLEELKSFFKM